MAVLKYRLVVNSRTVEMRRLGIKTRTYENVKVFLGGTSGRGATHWAAKSFNECYENPDLVTYFSGNEKRPGIIGHGDHVHVLFRNKNKTLMVTDDATAENELFRFVEAQKEKGVKIKLERTG